MRIQTRSTKARRGVAVMEFTFSLLFLIPLLLGIFIFGFKLIRSLEMTQVTRDLGAMYLRGVDFRGAGAQQTAADFGPGLQPDVHRHQRGDPVQGEADHGDGLCRCERRCPGGHR